MASSSRSRRKHNIAPITIDELIHAPGMQGLVSFLNIPPKDAQAGDDQPETVSESITDSASLTDSETQTVSGPQTASDGQTGLESDQVQSPCESPTVSDLQAAAASGEALTDSGSATVSDSLSGSVLPRPSKPPKRAVLVQDGHSAGEELLYQAMWRAGTPENDASGEPESKLLTAGWDRLARISGLHWTNARKNVFRLMDKLSIDLVHEENSSTRTGRQYRVWSYTAILRRRKAAGLVWVERTKGVRFVSPTVSETQTVGDATTVRVSQTVGGRLTGAGSGTLTDAVSDSLTPLDSSSRQTLQTSPPPAIIAALFSAAGVADDAAARKLIAGCLKQAPDATEDEILHFIRLKAATPGVRTPLSFLLTAVPRCFEGESFRRFRHEQQQGREERRQRIDAMRQEAERILADPGSGEDMRQWARETLEELRSSASTPS